MYDSHFNDCLFVSGSYWSHHILSPVTMEPRKVESRSHMSKLPLTSQNVLHFYHLLGCVAQIVNKPCVGPIIDASCNSRGQVQTCLCVPKHAHALVSNVEY